MDGRERRREHLLRLEEVPEVSAREAAAGEAVAALLDRPEVLLEARVPQVQASLLLVEDARVPRVAGRHDAVEHVDPARDAVEDVPGRPYAHEVSGFML